MRRILESRNSTFTFMKGALAGVLLFLVAAPVTVQAQWSKITIESFGFTVSLNPYFITMEDGTLFMGTNNAGMYKSTDGGTTWEATEVPSGVSQFMRRNGELWVVQVNSGPYLSTDGGASWTPAAGNLPTEMWPVFHSLVEHEGQLFIAVHRNNPDNYAAIRELYRSSDDAATWELLHTFEKGIDAVWSADGKLYVASNGIHQSTDGGVTLEPVTGEVRRAVAEADGTLIATDEYNVYLSADGGASWTGHSEGFEPFTRPFGLTVHGDQLFVVGIPVGMGAGKLYRASLDEMVFTEVSDSLSGKFTYLLGIVDGNMYVKENATVHYRPVSDFGLSSPPTTGVSIEHDGNALPGEYVLHDNYPNPFNPQTTIKFDLPEATSVTVNVYDAMGRLVDTLVNESLSAGSYRYTWSAGNHSSGLYLYRLVTPGFIGQGSMMLLK